MFPQISWFRCTVFYLTFAITAQAAQAEDNPALGPLDDLESSVVNCIGVTPREALGQCLGLIAVDGNERMTLLSRYWEETILPLGFDQDRKLKRFWFGNDRNPSRTAFARRVHNAFFKTNGKLERREAVVTRKVQHSFRLLRNIIRDLSDDEPGTGELPDPVTKTITPSGGEIELSTIAKAIFSAGDLDVDARVTMSATREAQTRESLDDSTAIFRPSQILTYEIRLNTGALPPISEDVRIEIDVPTEFIDALVPGHGIEVLSQALQAGDSTGLDLFEIIPSVFNSSSNTVTVQLPSLFFEARTNDGTFEAVIVLAATAGVNQQSPMSLQRQINLFRNVSDALAATNAQTTQQCSAASIGCPIGQGCDPSVSPVSSPYNRAGRVHPVYGGVRPHWGTDFSIPTGTDIVASADGVIERTKDNPGGYGLYIVINHADGSATLYAHLDSFAVSVGETVKAGQIIGKSGNTGSSTGPHLHFEYAPNGAIINSKSRIDPFPCIGNTVDGSITVGDNGNLADDAFEVFFDGVRLGATSIGATNTLSVSNLRSGDHTLSIKGIVVPDNVGTYEVNLSDGLTFSDGGTQRSGIVRLNATVTFNIIVP